MGPSIATIGKVLLVGLFGALLLSVLAFVFVLIRSLVRLRRTGGSPSQEPKPAHRVAVVGLAWGAVGLVVLAVAVCVTIVEVIIGG